jgi:hypothetical protein
MRILLSVFAGLLVAGMVPAGQSIIDQGDLQRAMIARSNPGVAEELKLSAAEESRLLDLLNQHQTAQHELSNRIGQSQDPVEKRDLIQQQVPLQRQLQDSIASMLGRARYRQWQEYEQTRSARIQAANIASILARAGRSLNGKQQKSVVNALIAEQQRQRQEFATTRPANALSVADLASADYSARVRELSVKSAQDSKRRTLDAVTPILNERQLATLRAEFGGLPATPGTMR